jgi:hypothetical protein
LETDELTEELKERAPTEEAPHEPLRLPVVGDQEEG